MLFLFCLEKEIFVRNTDPDKMALSSADETKGIEPINRAVELVRLRISEDFLQENGTQPEGDELPVIYVVWFAYILGGWKAMASTSESNGHYYEVTYNKAKGETYIDRYSKDYNDVVTDTPPISTSDAPNVARAFQQAAASGSVHITPPPPGPSIELQAAIARSAQRNARPRYPA